MIVSLWIKLLNFLSFLTFIISCHLLSRNNEFFEWVKLKLHQTIHPFLRLMCFSKILLISFWESLLSNHLIKIYSNVRGYWVFIQKHFISFFEIKTMKNEWDLLYWYLVPQFISKDVFLIFEWMKSGLWKNKQRDLKHDLLCVMRFLN